MSSASEQRGALVTGAASGIGRAIAAQLESDGFRVLSVDLKAAEGGPGEPFAADLTSAPAWEYVPRELRAIAAPVVVVSGERSPAVRRATARALVELLPTARMVEADAGHYVHLEDPAAVAEAVRGLL